MIPDNTFTITIFYYHGNKQGSVLNVDKTKFKHTFNIFPEVYEKLYSGKVIHKCIIYTLLLSLTYEIINYQKPFFLIDSNMWIYCYVFIMK